MHSSTLTLRFAESPGALDRIIGLLRRRGFPLAGMTLERTHANGEGRMTLVIDEPSAAEQVLRHLRRLPDVTEVSMEEDGDTVQREYALVRVRCSDGQRPELLETIARYHARTVCTGDGCVVVEVAGNRAEVDEAFSDLAQYGIEESARTNPMALRRRGAEAEWQTA